MISAKRLKTAVGVWRPRRERHCLVAIGASTGGPAALAEVLSGLPADLAAAVVIVQHVDPRFVPALAEQLQEVCGLPVRIAQEGKRVEEAVVFIAASDDHLTLLPGRTFGYRAEPIDCLHRPSVDVFFESASLYWPGEVIGVILTGMGADGAAGLKRLRETHHHTIGQDQATSVVYGMPKAAAESGAVAEAMPIGRIAKAIVREVRLHILN